MSYSKKELIDAIRSCGVERGDLIMVHTGMSSLRDIPEGVKGQAAMSAFCAEVLVETVGKDGTIVIPSFTYSLGAGEVYDPEVTPCKNIGAFPEYFRKLPGVARSRDPFLAVAAIGSMAKEIISGTRNTSYGRGSFFDKFTCAGGKIVCIGVGIRWATIRYYFDEIGKAPFRYLKLFTGMSKGDGKLEEIAWEYSVAPRAPLADAMSRRQGFIIEERMNKGDILNRASVGKGYVCAISASDYKNYILEMLAEDPWASSEGTIDSVERIIEEERKRTGVQSFDITIKDSGDIDEVVAAIEKMPCEMLTDGYDHAISELSRVFDVDIKTFPTGTRSGEFIVPERKIGDMRSFDSLKIGVATTRRCLGNGRMIVGNLCKDPRFVVEQLQMIKKEREKGHAAEDITLIIVPDAAAAVLMEG